MLEKNLSHIDSENRPQMVNIEDKKKTLRKAHARCFIEISDEISQCFVDGEIKTPKGPVFTTAIVAGTIGMKKTSDLIPFCHPLSLERCDIKIQLLKENKIQIDCIAGLEGKTGVEMEALMGANITALTIYDTLKAISHKMKIIDIHLVSKTGGKSDIHEN